MTADGSEVDITFTDGVAEIRINSAVTVYVTYNDGIVCSSLDLQGNVWLRLILRYHAAEFSSGVVFLYFEHTVDSVC